MAVNLADLWGGTEDCRVAVKYIERVCLDNLFGFDVFGMELDEMKWEGFDPNSDCGKKYIAFKNSVASQSSQAVSKFDIKLQILLADAALENSARRAMAQNPDLYNCAGGGGLITGKVFFGACAVACMKWIEIPPHGENDAYTYVLKTNRILCGSNCCTATQTFCRKTDGSITGSAITFNNDGSCVSTNMVSTCNPSQGHFSSECISACDFNPLGMKISNSIKNDLVSIDIHRGIKANIQNNAITKILSIGFISDFKGTISLFDVSGRLVYSQNTKVDAGANIQIETVNFDAGVYLLSLQSEQHGVVTEKLIFK
jgi:hypothetical protein